VSKAHLGEFGPSAPVQEVVGTEQIMGKAKQQAFGGRGVIGSIYHDNGKSKE